MQGIKRILCPLLDISEYNIRAMNKMRDEILFHPKVQYHF